ncbi:class I SAM-dependent methyltransferase [soil metagenome]
MTALSTGSFDAALAAVADVEGWMTDGQARLLWDAAREVPPGGRIVEIGSFRGRSTIVLGRAVADDIDLVAVDPHAGNDRGPQQIAGFADEAATDHEVFLANLAAGGVAERVRHVRKFSSDAHGEVADPLDLVYVDGAHRLGPARQDLQEWGARIRPGGTLLVHDAFSSVGVALALIATVFFGGRFRYVGRSRSLVVYRRDDLTPGGRVANAVRQAAQLPWFARNVLIKALIVARLGPVTRLFGHDPAEWPY